jgi:hypothetical protein
MRGSTSTVEGDRKRRFECIIEKTVVGGEASGRYNSEGRGAG